LPAQGPSRRPLLADVIRMLILPLITAVEVTLNDVGPYLPFAWAVIVPPFCEQVIAVEMTPPVIEYLVKWQDGFCLSISCGPFAACSGVMQ
jgi:hypothetical protein